METLFTLAQFAFAGFVCLVIVALVFGKRIEHKWDLEAKFRDAKGLEIGEFEIELWRIAKEKGDYTLDADFDLRHPGLAAGQRVRVYLEGEVVMEGSVEKAGRIRLDESHLCAELKSPEVGQVVSVRCGEQELVTAELRPD